jgi:tetratricopeptide (TPR) repeat protein
MADDALRGRNAFLEEAEAFLAAGDDETALALAEVRLVRMPGDLDAQSVICRVRIRQGRLDETEEMLRGIEVSLASLSRVYASLGDAYRTQGMQESAQICYRKCMSLNPDARLSSEIAERLAGIATMPETDPEREAGDAAAVPSDFQTVTLAELYIRQGHLRLAAEVLETIIRKEPQHEKAAALLREVLEMILREESQQQYPHVIGELSRWLDNIGSLRGHAA